MEDGHPILILSAKDIAGVLRKSSITSSNIEQWFMSMDRNDNRKCGSRLMAYDKGVT